MNTQTTNNPRNADGRLYERLDQKLRAQHMLMVTSFVTCVVTGMPLKYPDWKWMQVIVDLMGGVEATRILHRVGAVVMTADFLWHLIDMLVRFFRARMRFWQIELLPTWRDFREFFRSVGSYLGLCERPRFGRLNYVNKFDYWAVFWGMAIMVGSGVVMWFPELAGRFLPTRWIVATMIAHSDEGLLAFLAIVIWHIFNVHLHPRTFPMSWVWLTGTMTAEEMKHEYPEEYERIKDLPPPPGIGRWPVVGAILGVFAFSVVGILAYGSTRPARPVPPIGISEHAEAVAKQSVAGIDPGSPLFAEAFKARRREMHEQFHLYLPPAELPAAYRSACLLSGCHTDLPHRRNAEVRAYMNMHTMFMTCEACHYAKPIDDIAAVRYDWFDHGLTRDPLTKAPPPGTARDEKGRLVGLDNYALRIAPYRERDGEREVVFRRLADPKVLEYELARGRMTLEQAGRMKAEFHRDIAPAGPACDQCHTTNGRLDYKALGFSPERAKELEMLRVTVSYFMEADKKK